MLVVDYPSDMLAYVGKELGASDWVTVDQDMINRFADVTGDRNWFHVDVERAAREMPGGKTIAHGALIYSLMARMMESIYTITHRQRGLNYGVNRLRYTMSVTSGARIRLWETLVDAKRIGGGVQLTSDWRVEIEGEAKPALVAQGLILAFGEEPGDKSDP